MQYHAPESFRQFKAWVRRNKSEADFLSVHRLKPKSEKSISHCTQANVSMAMDDIQRMAEECGICRGGVLLAEKGNNLVVCDEKAFSSKPDPRGVLGVVTKSHKYRARGVSAEANWNHISLLSFSPLAGEALTKSGVVTPTHRYHRDFGRIWPEAVFEHSNNGSMTPEIFCVLVNECCLIPLRQAGVQGTILLLADSGGGGLLHLCPALAILLERQDCRMYVLKSDLTSALCALDQDPHKVMQEGWQLGHSHCGRTKTPLTLFMAIALMKEAARIGMAPDVQRRGWEKVGFAVGQTINKKRVLQDRSAELFHERPEKFRMRSATGMQVLSTLQAVTPKKIRCEKCRGLFGSDMKYCGHCGTPSPHHNEEARRLTQTGPRAGWSKHRLGRTDYAELEATAKATGVARHVGDFLAEIRKRKHAETSPNEHLLTG